MSAAYVVEMQRKCQPRHRVENVLNAGLQATLRSWPAGKHLTLWHPYAILAAHAVQIGVLGLAELTVYLVPFVADLEAGYAPDVVCAIDIGGEDGGPPGITRATASR